MSTGSADTFQSLLEEMYGQDIPQEKFLSLLVAMMATLDRTATEGDLVAFHSILPSLHAG